MSKEEIKTRIEEMHPRYYMECHCGCCGDCAKHAPVPQEQQETIDLLDKILELFD